MVPESPSKGPQARAPLPPEVLALAVRGRRLGPALLDETTFGEAVGRGPTLLVFLRHFG